MIQGTSLDALRLMEFFALCSNVNDYLAAEDLTALKLNAVHTETYLPAFNALDDALKPFRKTGLTQTLLDLDARRDEALVGLAKIARSFIDFPVAEKAQTADLVKRTIDKYGKSPQALGLFEQTGVMINLLQDLSKADLKASVEAIGATPWVEILQETNNQFVEIFKQRTEEEAAIETGKTKAARFVMQKALTHTCKLINALAMVNNEAPYRGLTDNINREISRAKQIVKQRRNAKATAGEDEIPDNNS